MVAKNRPRCASDASEIENAYWNEAEVRGHYSYRNSHSDLYSFLGQWSDLGAYLNAGFSGPGQRHWSPKSHFRLVDTVASGLLALHKAGPYSKEYPTRLLDIASGRGGPAIYVHEHYGIDVDGLDFTDFNVKRATRNAAQRHVTQHVRFARGDAMKLPFADGVWSLAWSIESPAHFSDKRQFLQEASRVLRPGAAFAFADLLPVDRIVMESRRNRKIYEDFLQAWDVPNLKTLESYRVELDKANFLLRDLEIATSRNLGHFDWYCRNLGPLFKIEPFYRMYRGFVKARAGVDLDAVREVVLKSWRALRLGMINYGIFWTVKRTSNFYNGNRSIAVPTVPPKGKSTKTEKN